MSRYGIPRKRTIAQLILFTYMFPQILLGIPFFSLFGQLGLLNSLFGLSLAHLTLSFPFALWLMWQTFQGLPREYEEAAAIDGAGPLRTFLLIVCPMVRPALAAIFIFAFAASWNDYTLSLMLVRDNQMLTLPVSVSLFVTQLQFNWAVIQSGAILLAVPGLILLLLGQRYLVRAFGGGGLATSIHALAPAVNPLRPEMLKGMRPLSQPPGRIRCRSPTVALPTRSRAVAKNAADLSAKRSRRGPAL